MGRNLATCLGKMPRRRVVLRWRLRVRTPVVCCPSLPCSIAQVALGCGIGGCSHPDHMGITSRRFFASCLRFCRPLSASVCLVSFALSRSSLAVGCLCALRHLPPVAFCVTGHLVGLTRTSGGTAAAVLRACGGMPDRFGRLEGAERRRRSWSARHLRRNQSF